MLASSSSIFKNIAIKSITPKSLTSLIRYNSSTKFAGFTDRVYQKLTVKRFPHEQFTLYIDTTSTIE